MPPRGARGGGYTFDILDLTTRSESAKVFELRSKSGRGSLGLVRWSPPHRAYILCPDANVMVLTTEDLAALHDFVSRQNTKEATRKMAMKT